MRQITSETIQAFNNSKKFKKSNMEVEVLPNVTIMKLHDNEIAYRYNDPNRTLKITNAGWKTRTTKERLNGLSGVRIYQEKGDWFLNGEYWNGKLVNVDKYTKQGRRERKIDEVLETKVD